MSQHRESGDPILEAARATGKGSVAGPELPEECDIDGATPWPSTIAAGAGA